MLDGVLIYQRGMLDGVLIYQRGMLDGVLIDQIAGFPAKPGNLENLEN